MMISAWKIGTIWIFSHFVRRYFKTESDKPRENDTPVNPEANLLKRIVLLEYFLYYYMLQCRFLKLGFMVLQRQGLEYIKVCCCLFFATLVLFVYVPMYFRWE